MAGYDVISLGETVVALGADTPVPTFQIVPHKDPTGPPLNDEDVGSITLEIIPISYVGDSSTLADGVFDASNDSVSFAWGDQTDTPGSVRSVLHAEVIDVGTVHLFGPTYTIYDPADLWVNPADVKRLVEGEFTDSEVVHAILFAQNLVRAWVSIPVQSPVPDAIRQATTLLAARALTTASSEGTSSGRIIAETIADYTVRYADPGFDEAAGAFITPEIAALLAPYRGTAYDVVVGPVNRTSPLPVTLPELAQIGDFVYSPFIYIDDEDTP